MTMRVRAVLTLIAAAAMMGLTSCDHYVCSSGATFGSSSCTPSGSGLGGGGNGSGTVFAYLLGESGSTVMVADSLDLSTNTFQVVTNFVAPPLPSTVPADGGTVVVSKGSQKYLYIPFNDGTLYGYAIDGATGALTGVPNIPYSVTGGTSIASDPAGNFLFVGDSATGDISVFSISATDGSLIAVGSAVVSGISVAQMTTDGLGKYLYATAGAGGTQIAAFTITAGTLSLVSGSPFTFSASKVLGENTGNFLLGIDGQTADISVFSIASNGAITLVGSPVVTAAVPVNLVVHPSGKFVYTFDGPTAPMEGYQIGSGGTLTAVASSPFTGVDLDQGQFDQTGLFLFGVGSGLGATFGAYGADTSSGAIFASTFPLLGFLGHGFAVTDLTNAP